MANPAEPDGAREAPHEDGEHAALRALLAERLAGPFVPEAEAREATRRMIVERRAALQPRIGARRRPEGAGR